MLVYGFSLSPSRFEGEQLLVKIELEGNKGKLLEIYVGTIVSQQSRCNLGQQGELCRETPLLLFLLVSINFGLVYKCIHGINIQHQ